MAWLGRGKQKTAIPQPEMKQKAPPPAVQSPELERRATEIGRELLKMAREHKTGIFSARFWSDQLMNWSMKDPAFKIQLFRFIDVFPMLHTPALVHDYLTDYLGQPGVTLPPGMDIGLKAGGLAKGIMAKTISNRITAMAQNFIAGVDAASALPTLKKQWGEGVAFSVDLLGEACLSDEEAAAYQKRYLDLVETLPGTVAGWPSNPLLENDHLGPIPRTNVSIKISSLCARTDPIDFEGSLRALTDGLRPILEKAAENNVLVNFDMEQYALKDLTLSLFERCCEQIDFPAGLALQAYLRSAEDDAQRIIDWSKRTGRQVAIRLIKGAYWDFESIHAERMGWPVPVWTDKRLTDACFERVATRLVEAIPEKPGEGGVKLALGSHNIRSIAYTMALVERRGLPKSALEVQMLSGMADQLRRRLVRPRPAHPRVHARRRDDPRHGLFRPPAAGKHVEPVVAAGRILRRGFGRRAAGLAARAGDGEARLHDGRRGRAAAQSQPAVEGLGDEVPMFNESMRDFAQSGQREPVRPRRRSDQGPGDRPRATARRRPRRRLPPPTPPSPPGATAIRSTAAA